jgi:hypothetical protein
MVRNFRLADEKPLPIGDTEDELVRLLKSRRNELLAACQDFHASIEPGGFRQASCSKRRLNSARQDVAARADVAEPRPRSATRVAAMREIDNLVRVAECAAT